MSTSEGPSRRPSTPTFIKKRFQFCPQCHNLLVITFRKVQDEPDQWVRKCRTCPYTYVIEKKERYVIQVFNDDGDDADIVETAKTDEHRQRTEILCPKCNHNEAFFYQMQTRSADEPMTTFYECTKKDCRNIWRD